MSAPVDNKIETKVSVASVVALLAAIAIELLNAFVANHSLFGDMNPVLQGILLVAIPPIVVFLGGYAAPHTARQYPPVDNGPQSFGP